MRRAPGFQIRGINSHARARTSREKFISFLDLVPWTASYS